MTLFEPTATFHAYTHANGSENLFRTDDNYLFFLKKYEKYINPVADTFAYCLMPNHLHLMIRIRSRQEIDSFLQETKPDRKFDLSDARTFSNVISHQFSHLLNGYTQAYNKVFKRRGSLFIPNLKRNGVKDDDYLTRLFVYIHANPIKHKFAEELHEWRYSSYTIYLSDEPTNIKREEGLKWFGNKEEFVKIHHQLTKLSKGFESLESL